MGARTGKPRGRPAGVKNVRTLERQQEIAEVSRVIESALERPFTGDAHTLLMTVYKDEAQPLERRIDAAKAAIAYEKPKLASVDNTHAGPDGGPVQTSIEVSFVTASFSDEEEDGEG
jgi:hypothetical protein